MEYAFMNISPYTIRKAYESDAEGIAFVHVNSWKTSYAGIIDQDFLDDISYDRRLAFWKETLKSKNTLHLVAVFDDQIIGFADAGSIRPQSVIDHHPLFKDKKEKIGEIYAIYLLEHHKGKGLGKALFQRCRLWFDQEGLEFFVVWALVDNIHAKHFYEKEGGKPKGEKTITIDDKNYPEACYLFRTQTL